MTPIRATSIVRLAPCLLVLAMAGCAQEPPPQEEPFFAESDQSSVTRVADVQAARGARADATLYPIHFDAAALNALGRSKLKLMLSDCSEELPITVYVDGESADAQASARREAVKAWFEDSGLRAEQYRIQPGRNPAAWHAAAGALQRIQKTESGSTGMAPENAGAAPQAAGSPASLLDQTSPKKP
jgi:hypothetical protein